MWCLIPSEADKFKDAILSGRIDPEALAEMSSAERRELFAREVGESNAQPMNELFESKLLLKNRQQGYVSWARKVLGENTPAGRDVISRIERMDQIFSAADEKAFLNDLAAKRLGTEVTFDEAKIIADLAKKIETGKADFEAGGDRIPYGLAMVNLRNYVGDLKTKADHLTLGDFKSNPFRSSGKFAWTALQTAKAVKAAWDASAVFRPGVKVLMTHPKIWQNNARKMFQGIVDTYRDKEILDSLYADLLTRENALNGFYKTGKLDIGITEEAYPTDVPERLTGFLGKKLEQTKVPIVSKVVGRAVGKTYKASQDAYALFNNRTRADLFDMYVKVAEQSGVDFDAENLEAIGRMVNSLVGRGRLGPLEPVAQYVNVPFFSPKMLKSHVDVLFEPLSGGGGGFIGQEAGTNFVRKQAALNLLKIIGGTAAVLGLAALFDRDSVEPDPRSSDFGKIRVGDTRFDVTGGWSSIAILASRLATMKKKSSITGEVKEINERDKEGKLKFGTPTGKDLIYDFFENKQSPPFAVLSDILEGQTFAGEKPTLLTSLRDLYEPLPLGNIRELKNNPNSAPLLIAMIADGLGIATNTYSAKPGAVVISNKAVSDELKRLKIDINGAGTKDAELDKLINAQIGDRLSRLDLPKGATDTGAEKLIREQISQIRALANAEAALKDPKRYTDYLKSKEGSESVSVLTDEEKKTLTEQDLTNYRSRYAEAYVEVLQRASQAPNWSKLTNDEKEKVLARIPRIAHNRAKIDLVKTKRKGTP